ncbi:Glucoamylase (glucan-1,4-alpha-glucosidase), GH15 family [Pedococcus cremeus]|uniref:Glucoamylase (Glucan-1,4-alpha-glucosidase), GH15 family n=1 Tax=Pedococcus cremeus TaxID=587636 RepID=A0A1H9VMT6_9MICO|nr:glycoside hydrolase family 15 protein [Pedococcus cremeus]SES23015.1 Glucoamylase (glucan-1,4-alpha-glucosidase), GH15 family [Pedococcus cremeus]
MRNDGAPAAEGRSRAGGQASAVPAPRREGGFLPLRSYAALGDGRSIALVAEDGAIDWLAWPNLDSDAFLAALLDPGRGGSFTVAPVEAYTVHRRYLPGTDVLETVFHTASGSVRVLDALTFKGRRLGPMRELQRRVEGVTGSVSMAWSVDVRFGFGQRRVRLGRRAGVPVATAGAEAVAVLPVNAGMPSTVDGRICGAFTTTAGSRSVVALCGAFGEPLVLPTAADLEERFDFTVEEWRRWSGTLACHGPWDDSVLRSALVLKSLIFSPSGAVAAAATTSLPELIGGARNWDYRYSWVRDAAFTLGTLLRLGCTPEAEAYFWWLLQATQLTHPRLQPLYRLDGGPRARERVLPVQGYRDSRPVRVGNAAATQLQLDSYGELMDCVWLHVQAGGTLDPDIGRRLAQVAELVADRWREPDAGIWEVRSAPRHFTHSTMMCWVALDRADRMASLGLLPSGRQSHWRTEAAACAAFVEQRCYSARVGSYTRSAGSDDLDASVLLGLLAGYGDSTSERWRATVAAIRRGLGRGDLLQRYTGEDGLAGGEGAFVACAFWLAQALARTGQVAEAAALVDRLVALTNDVGLLAEEIDPETGDFLGNLPQGLSHLALISAAAEVSALLDAP